MKKLAVLAGLIFLGTILVASIKKYGPAYLYNKIVNEGYTSQWFYLNDFSKEDLKGKQVVPYSFQELKKPDYWQRFHFGELLIPLPYPSRNPYYTVIPNLGYDKLKKKSYLSFSITTVKGRILNKILALPHVSFPDYTQEQKVFELPLVRKIIKDKSPDQIWTDALTRPLVGKNFTVKEMLYNLYLLQFRSDFINPKVEDYYLYEGTLKGIFKLKTDNLDFSSELIMEKRGNRIFTYLIMSRHKNKEAKKIRDHLIKNIGFMESTPSLTDITFQEFKNLPYKDQVFATGSLYLISAWSHGKMRKNLIKQAIDFLERGARDQHRQHFRNDNPDPNYKAANLLQLKPLYLYYLQRYGKFHSSINVPGLKLDPMIRLMKDIEKENTKKREEEFNSAVDIEAPPRKSIEEQFRDIIKKTRKPQKKTPKNKIRFN